ncbi:DUF6907 domain-containing protein [Streptomyces sp. CBMA29]|uniref:DUF6907 domain-containing protein n=1 Tax=Streptomyces sp. CBMA29 TaxID=1896314 RepID=UPI00166193A9|nr:hypothetical protein [Streptomyces sp. CBMA29]MBD0740543.1 hypothetical protein [Streptomyces sp. CBMA29]
MITADDGSVVAGHLPDWAQEDPTTHGVPADQLPARMADITHWADFEGASLRVHAAGTGGAIGLLEEVMIFASSIMCHPFPDSAEPRLPFAEVQITPDCWMTGLDPDALVALAATLRTLADRIENDVRPLLLSARTDWAAHHPSPVRI